MNDSKSDYTYEEDTKSFYQDSETAEKYHESFKDPSGLNGIRFKLVSSGERSAVERFLDRVPVESIVDVPAGTGKLAPVLASTNGHILSVDVSQEMLSIARSEYRRLEYEEVEFLRGDVESISSIVGTEFNVAVCLRLLHRVPRENKMTILRELSEIAGHAIISFGVESRYHRIRRSIRSQLLGGGDQDYDACYERLDEIESFLKPNFRILGRQWVVPMLSQEVVYLLKSRQSDG